MLLESYILKGMYRNFTFIEWFCVGFQLYKRWTEKSSSNKCYNYCI